MKRFKTKKKHYIIKFITLFIIMLFSMTITFNYCVKYFGNKVDMKKLAKYLIKEGFNNQINKYKDYDPLNIAEPLQLIQSNLNFKYINNNIDIVETLENNKEDISEPLVYIYNTHDEEKYKYLSNGAYNIVPNVRLASLILEEKLNDIGINTISEDKSIQTILNEHQWSYKDSYKASRLLLEEAKDNYESLKYYIDIHRDSISKDKTTLEYNDDEYARILFVIGSDNKDYDDNLEMANKINNYLNDMVPDISRGISMKEGPLVNGVYNQDFSSNLILIEIGGNENNIVEVSNSINILADALYKYIKGDNYAKEKI